MSNSPLVLLDAPSHAAQPEISRREKRQRWFELFLVLLMAIGSSLLQSLYLLHFGPSAAQLRSSPVPDGCSASFMKLPASFCSGMSCLVATSASRTSA